MAVNAEPSLFDRLKAAGFDVDKRREEYIGSAEQRSDDKRIGRMLVTAEEASPIENFPLLALGDLDAKELLATYQARQARYATTPFDPSGNRLRLFPGGVTIWSGFAGAGKTTLLRQLACHLLVRNESVFIASLEERATDLVVRLASTAAGMREVDEAKIVWFCDWYLERLRVWGEMGTARHRKMLAAIRGTKCTHAIIDSLMCLDIDNNDWNAQRIFVNEICALAEITNSHVHLVAHPRKPLAGDQEPTLSDVAGARELGNRVDNVLFIRRASGERFGDDACGMRIHILKQRHNDGGLGEVTGWYHRPWRQFHVEQFPIQPIRYLPNEAYIDA